MGEGSKLLRGFHGALGGKFFDWRKGDGLQSTTASHCPAPLPRLGLSVGPKGASDPNQGGGDGGWDSLSQDSTRWNRENPQIRSSPDSNSSHHHFNWSHG
ncbi:hypothetical protein CRG98_035530 [Punica granatum]|uniref:Uncharacterized protein n=1 Tax=Punica granatum TaxID=22663 RepID=A0A2I0IJ81_PUNGR|nr:hypothetical protein CRG98_035530 [Punica granatum]